MKAGIRSLAAAEHKPTREVVVDLIGVPLERIARRLGASWLLESPDGRIVGHALSHAPPPSVTAAVPGRTSVPLHDAARRGRTVAVLPGGA